MRYTSARAAWHDCFYSGGQSKAEAFEEQCKLGTYVQQTSKINTCMVVVHQAQAGLIQSAITTLPPPLQMLGHWLYAPEDFIPSGAENAIWKMIAVLCGIDDEDSDEWYLIRCSMHRYRELAWQRPQAACALRSPKQIKEWLFLYHNVEIDTRRWARKQSRIWDRSIKKIDELDKKLLTPVTHALVMANDDMADEDYFAWDRRLIALRG